MNIKDMINNDADLVFLPDNDGGFNEEVFLYPHGRPSKKMAITAIWIEDGEIGTNEAWGDGVTLNDREGRKVRASVNMECSSDLPIRADQPRHNFDVVQRGDEWFAVKRIISQDADMMTVRLVETSAITLRSNRRSG